MIALDLRSDTVTRPTPAMRAVMANADVGDDVLDGDPTVRALEAACAERLGMDWALFVPTGTMGNLVGITLGSRPGTEIVLDANAHIIHWEIAGPAMLAGVQVRPVAPSAQVMRAADLSAGIRPRSPHAPRSSLVCLENTHNHAGGVVTSAADLTALAHVARTHALGVHLDGARLWNAHIATGTPLAAFTASVDTVMCSFSKGLGAPAGAIIAGRIATRADAYEIRKRLGGGMRQSGILAAGAWHGLTEHLARLADDHAAARRFAETLASLVPRAGVVTPDTNIVMVDLPAPVAEAVVARAAAAGVRIGVWHASRIRAVWHLDAPAEHAEAAATVVADAIAAAMEAGAPSGRSTVNG
ncbi:MAG: GntG family PLP-dependent aldolase [Gemmatimonadaceae bacterium]|nr:GntG family PLP-dependent aldolase [Gemmatimonadaceae bacterium]